MDLKNLFCIDLDLPGMTGFRKFISSWCYRGPDWSVLVDPGPLATVPVLVEALRNHSVERLDYVLLSHIHIDHAGGTGALLREFPEARVVCHPEGIRHLVAPEKLWEGSKKVLGDLAGAYGEIVPVPEESIGFAETVGETGIRAFLTPGHAQHHCSYLLNDLLFAGEVAGVRGETPEGPMMRPATPPRFILQTALDSIDAMIRLNPRYLVFAHYGLSGEGVESLRIARFQLQLWVLGALETAGLAGEERTAALTGWIRERDPYYARVSALPDDIRQREDYFLGNSLKGITEFVDGLPPEERTALREELLPQTGRRP